MFTKSPPEIYYEKIGTGKPLILLHGNKEDHTIFNKLTASLKNSFTVYSIDSRGHGKSSSTKLFITRIWQMMYCALLMS